MLTTVAPTPRTSFIVSPSDAVVVDDGPAAGRVSWRSIDCAAPAHAHRGIARREATARDLPVARVSDRLRVERFDHVTDRDLLRRGAA